jgi:uncharacterized protein YutE (UPF0331/DUF86 family)
MKIDRLRIRKFLSEIQKDTVELEEFLKASLDDKRTIKAIRYNLIEIIEAVANILQHILAKDKGSPSSGYLEIIEFAKKEKIISQSAYAMLKPFFEFRNTLVHRYWTIKDDILIKNLNVNYRKFYDFIKEIEGYLKISNK